MTDRKIITKYDGHAMFADIVWQATFEDYERGDHVGFGATESAAIADLMVWEEMDR